MPVNPGQLTVLNSTEATAIRAAADGLALAEVALIYWPSPTGTQAYTWWNLPLDPLYTTPLTNWLGSIPVTPAFEADNPDQPFHQIPITAGIGDDVVQMRVTNENRTFEGLCYDHRGGVKVEFYWFYPQITDTTRGNAGKAVHRFTGYLRRPDECNADFVSISASSGLRSANITLPNDPHGQNCTVYFGGELAYEDLVAHHPCDYNRHLTAPQQAALGGARGTLNGGVPWTNCPHTREGCLSRMGDTLSYMGDDAVLETSQIGAGQHKTRSTVVGNQNRLVDVPVAVPYGSGHAESLPLLAFAREINPSVDHLDKGSLRVLMEVGCGSIDAISNVKLIDIDPQGMVIKLGTQQQSPTTFSANVLNYNRRAHLYLVANPVDPTKIQVQNMTASCDFVGRNTVRVYSDATTFVEQYTANRAWCLLELLTSTWFGFRLDPAELRIADFIYLASKNSTFNCYVLGTSAQQKITDIVQSGRWYPPFYHDRIWRFLPIEVLDTTQADIPVFTDAGVGENILWDDERNVSRLSVTYRDDSEIPNEIVLRFADHDHDDIERPLVFADYPAQYRAGQLLGNRTKRRVEQQYSAYGVTDLVEAVPLGAMLRDIGPFGFGGTTNNLEVEFVCSGFNPDVINLHVTKAIKVQSAKLTPYTDGNGDVFETFIIKGLTYNPDMTVTVKAQAYGKIFWDGLCSPRSGYVTWSLTAPVNPNDAVINGPNGVSTKILTTASSSGSTGKTWDSPVVQADVITDRWVHTIADLPPTGNSYNVWHSGAPNQPGFKVWYNGQGWIYTEAGIDTTTWPAGTLQVGDTLSVEFDKNNGSPVRRYKRNGTTIHTDTTSVLAYNAIDATGFSDPGIAINDIFWEVFTCTPTDFQDTGTSGGTTTTTVAAPSAFVVVDRIFRDADLYAGVPGVYFGAAPTNTTDSWAAASLYVDRGAGFTEISADVDAAFVGTAATVLAGTTTGSETVRVDIQPGQELPSYTTAEVAAGMGYAWLGGEIFQYEDAAQISSTPNRWELSTLSNRGAKCTTAAIATHATSEDFLLLDSAVIFVALPATEIGQTRNYKGVTAGELVADATEKSYAFDAPNFVPVTPPDYSLSYDSTALQVVHDWTPITDPCAVTTGLIYEIYDDVSGSPGGLLWSGTASEWREPVTATGTRIYHFRAKNAYASGAYITAGITITAGGDGGLFGEPLFGE